MATMIAEHIVEKLIAASVVEEGDKELYVYGYFLMITRFFFFLVAIAFGNFFEIPCESVIFYVVFILLRSYAGGVHAKTETACTLWTTLGIGTAIAAVKMLESSGRIITPFLVFGNLCILLFSPLDSKEKPLSAKERRRFQKICYWLLLMCDITILMSFRLKFDFVYVPMVCGMCFEAVLLNIGKVHSWITALSQSP